MWENGRVQYLTWDLRVVWAKVEFVRDGSGLFSLSN